jgi:sigma-54 dependent transcriptional regulator, acetoin dehydrogenase operon transcriptional activator AcoR
MHVTSTMLREPNSPARRTGTGQFLVLIMESARPLAASARIPLHGARAVELGRAQARRVEETDDHRLLVSVPDQWMSSAHAALQRQGGHWLVEDRGSKNGTLLNGRLVQSSALCDGDIIEVGSTLFMFRDAAFVKPPVPGYLDADRLADEPEAFATLNPELAHEFQVLTRIAPTEVSVLILGETGAGKELAARAIHRQSGRTGPFVAVNCAALPVNLVESELFGYRRGAFSGASFDHDGYVRAAEGGTLFLDEIAELSEPAQASLLRFLQEREVVPIGTTQPVRVDVRVLAATHQDIAAQVEQGTFRKDLYARLAGYSLHLKPLRERRDDLGLLIRALVRRVCPVPEAVRFSPEAVRALLQHHWPMNVRELEQALRTGAAIAGDEEICLEHLPAAITNPTPPAVATPARHRDRAGEQHALLLALMDRHRGNISAIARDLATSRGQVHRMLKRFGIDPEAYRA